MQSFIAMQKLKFIYLFTKQLIPALQYNFFVNIICINHLEYLT